MDRLLMVVLALVPALSGLDRGLLVPGLKVSDLLIIALVILLLVRRRFAWDRRDPLGWSVLAYGVIQVVTTIINYLQRDDITTGELVKGIGSVSQFALLFAIAFSIGGTTGGVARWARYSVIFASSIAVIGLLQLADLGPTREIVSVLTGNPELANLPWWKTYRATGLFPSWHAYSMYLAMNALIALSMLLRGVRSERRLYFVTTVILFGGLLIGLTATPILVAAVGAVLLLPWKLLRRVIPVAVVAGVIVLVATPLGGIVMERLTKQQNAREGNFAFLPETLQFRVNAWVDGYFPIIGANFWTGYGPLGAGDTDVLPYAESMYIKVLTSGGIFLFLALLAVIFFAARSMFRIRRRYDGTRSDELSALARPLSLLVILVAVAQFLHPYMNDAGSAPMLFSALGIVAGAAYARSRETIGTARVSGDSMPGAEETTVAVAAPDAPVTRRSRRADERANES